VKTLLELNKGSYAVNTALYAIGAVGTWKAIGGLEVLLRTFGLLKPTIAETALAFAEFALPIVIVGGLYLLFDDLFTLMKGGHSVIGDDVDAMMGFGTAADGVAYLNDLLSTGLDLVEGLAQIVVGIAIPQFQALWDIVKGIVESLYDLATFKPGQALHDLIGAGSDIANDEQAGLDTIVGGAEQIFGGRGSHAYHRGAIGAPPAPHTREPTDFAYGDGRGRVPVSMSFGRGREPVGMTFGPEHAHVREPLGFGYGPGAGGGVVHQSNTFKIDVHTQSDQPQAVGQATGQGVATSAERATANAVRATRRS